MDNHFSFHSYWQKDKSDIKDELVAFWLANDVLKKGRIEQRIEEVVMICRNKDSKLIGASTVFKSPIEQLRNEVYVFRCFIAQSHRAPALDTQLVLKTFNVLDASIDSERTDKAIGLLMVVQNELIKKNWNKAIWPDTEMIYIGELPNGDHLRIRYFSNVKV